MKETFQTYLKITRGYAPLGMCLGALIGALVSGPVKSDLPNVLASLSSLYFLTAASFVFNDIFDLEVDRLNAIQRPLATGELSVRSAWKLWGLLTLLGFFPMLLMNLRSILLLLGFYALSLLYTAYLKKTGFLGNVAVALMIALTPYYGSLSVTNSPLGAVKAISVLAFLVALGREVLQGIADMEGDRKRNVKSLALLWGVKKAKIVGIASILLMVALAPPLMSAAGTEPFSDSLLYGYIVLVPGFVIACAAVWKAGEREELRRWLQLLNVLILLLLALLVFSPMG